jgi:hypothetical protein
VAVLHALSVKPIFFTDSGEGIWNAESLSGKDDVDNCEHFNFEFVNPFTAIPIRHIQAGTPIDTRLRSWGAEDLKSSAKLPVH